MENGISIGHHTHWNLFGITFNADTIISMWLVSAVLIILAVAVKVIFMNQKSIEKPGRFQVLMEMLVEFLKSVPENSMGSAGIKYFPFIGTLFIFILFSNWFELIPATQIYKVFFERMLGSIPEFIPPTSDINTTAGLALFTIVAVQYYGIRERKLKYFKKFIKPIVIFLPLNIMEELAKPFSLAIRLFGNIFGKETIIVVLVSLVSFPIIYPIPILMLSLLIGAIQAFVFSMLATVYVQSATMGEH